MVKKTAKKPRRVKIGTILDEETAKALRLLSAREGRPMSDVIMEAITQYTIHRSINRQESEAALDRLLSLKLNLSQADWNVVMDEDFYDQ
jgi:hypothetical protein